MSTNYVSDFAASYVAAVGNGGCGTYAEAGPEYHCLIDSYDSLFNAIKNKQTEQIDSLYKDYIDSFNVVQQRLEKSWEKVFPGEPYPKQSSIHGLVIVINKMLKFR